MEFNFSGLRQGRQVTLLGPYGDRNRFVLRGGANSTDNETWAKLQDDKVIQYHLNKQNITVKSAPPTLTVVPDSEPAETSVLDDVAYVPLVPTVEQLVPLPRVGEVRAKAIVKNAPDGGYVSPSQMIQVNELKVDAALIEVLFEIA